MSTRYRNYGGVLTKAGAPTSGVLQVETATVVGTITLAGDAKFTVTAALLTGSPKDYTVPVALNDTAAQVAGKARTVLAADSDLTDFYTVGGTSADVKLTTLQSAANDGTLNIAFTNDTCTGLTPDATSTHTTAGVKGDYKGVVRGDTVVDTTNHTIYENTGDETRPVWSAI